MRLKRLLIQNVDIMPWGPTAVVSKGRLNVGKAMDAMVAELQGGNPVVPSSPVSGKATPPPPSSPNANMYSPPATGTILPPACGTSPIMGRPANQSTNFGPERYAGKAVNGDCFNDMNERPLTCAATDPASSFPWWTSSLKTPAEFLGVSLTTRRECCWGSIGGAIIYVGNTTWTSRNSRANFTECGRVPSSGIPAGQRMTIKCTKPIFGSQVAVYLPKERTSLVLCEVDVTVRDSAVPAPSPRRMPPPPSKKKNPPPKRKKSIFRTRR